MGQEEPFFDHEKDLCHHQDNFLALGAAEDGDDGSDLSVKLLK